MSSYPGAFGALGVDRGPHDSSCGSLCTEGCQLSVAQMATQKLKRHSPCTSSLLCTFDDRRSCFELIYLLCCSRRPIAARNPTTNRGPEQVRSKTIAILPHPNAKLHSFESTVCILQHQLTLSLLMLFCNVAINRYISSFLTKIPTIRQNGLCWVY